MVVATFGKYNLPPNLTVHGVDIYMSRTHKIHTKNYDLFSIALKAIEGWGSFLKTAT